MPTDQLLRTGSDCYTYWSSGADYENPTWNLTKLVRDESIDLQKGRAEFMNRGSKFKRKKGTKIEAPASFGVEYRRGDAFIAKLWDSFLNNTPIDMAFMFDPIDEVGAEGLRMAVEVFDLPFTRDLEDGVIVECEVELTEYLDSSNELVDMEWYVVPAGP